MLLTDTDIVGRLKRDRNYNNEDEIVIAPYDERFLSPLGYDLRVGDAYQLLHEGVEHPLSEGEKLSIPPGETISIRTLEWLAMPRNGSLSAFICSRVMLVSSGASHISTSVDPDWTGNLLISFTNHSRTSISLAFGERLCTIVFIENKSRPTKVSQHPPGRPDALNKNASRIAALHRKERRKRQAILYVAWIVLSIVYAALVYWVHLKFGANSLFVALLAAGVILFGLGLELIKYLLNKDR